MAAVGKLKFALVLLSTFSVNLLVFALGISSTSFFLLLCVFILSSTLGRLRPHTLRGFLMYLWVFICFRIVAACQAPSARLLGMLVIFVCTLPLFFAYL